jgi:hypothetical protein
MKIAKALVASAIAGLTALGQALTDDRVTGQEWIVVAIAVLAGLGVTYAVPNRPTP